MRTLPTELTLDERDLTVKLNDAYRRVAMWRRDGTIVHVVREGGKIAPAYYDPRSGDVTLDLDAAKIDNVAKVSSKLIDPTWVDDRETARTLGLLQHEAAHSKWSQWLETATKLVPITRRQWAVIEMFEEIRIEKRACDVGGKAAVRKNLRASFDLVIENVDPAVMLNSYSASHAWALTVGRVKCGIVEAVEVQDIDIAARTLLGDDVIDVLSEILDEAVAVEIPYGLTALEVDVRWAVERLVGLAKEWLDVLGEPETGTGTTCRHHPDPDAETGAKGLDSDATADDPDSPFTPEEGDTPRPGKSDSDDEGHGADDKDGAGDESADDEAGDDDEADINTPDFGDVRDKAESESEQPPANLTDEQAAELLAEMIKKASERVHEEWNRAPELVLSNPEVMARKVFGEKHRRHPRNWQTRPATGEQNSAVVRLATEFERMAMPAIVKSTSASMVPPGRLKSREALRATLEKKQGRMVTAQPWKATRRRHDHVPPMTVGILTDTSGSMRWAEDFVADAAYVVSHAGHRIGARFAAVTFGNNAEAVVKPNDLPSEVTVRSANGSDEAFDEAVAAIDGVLHLTSTRGGAKVLIVVTDGELVRTHEMEKAQLWVDKLRAGGTLVIQVAYPGSSPIGRGVEVMAIEKANTDQLVKAIVRGLQTSMTHRG